MELLGDVGGDRVGDEARPWDADKGEHVAALDLKWMTHEWLGDGNVDTACAAVDASREAGLRTEPLAFVEQPVRLDRRVRRVGAHLEREKV